jgi:hypothetical protein
LNILPSYCPALIVSPYHSPSIMTVKMLISWKFSNISVTKSRHWDRSCINPPL